MFSVKHIMYKTYNMIVGVGYYMINRLLNLIYFTLKKKEIKKARIRMKKISIDDILDLIIKNCEDKSVEYKILEKNHDTIAIDLFGKKEKVLLKYHKSDMVFKEDYNEFINKLKREHVDKGIYVTTGLFETEIHKRENRLLYLKKIVLDDYYCFFKKQIRLFGKADAIFDKKQLNFYRYLPK